MASYKRLISNNSAKNERSISFYNHQMDSISPKEFLRVNDKRLINPIHNNRKPATLYQPQALQAYDLIASFESGIHDFQNK